MGLLVPKLTAAPWNPLPQPTSLLPFVHSDKYLVSVPCRGGKDVLRTSQGSSIHPLLSRPYLGARTIMAKALDPLSPSSRAEEPGDPRGKVAFLRLSTSEG